jgi:hypothetical protein
MRTFHKLAGQGTQTRDQPNDDLYERPTCVPQTANRHATVIKGGAPDLQTMELWLSRTRRVPNPLMEATIISFICVLEYCPHMKTKIIWGVYSSVIWLTYDENDEHMQDVL